MLMTGIGIIIGERGLVMDYLSAKFSDFSFSRFSLIVRTSTQIYTVTLHRIMDAAKRF